jgi:hypothetical protein
MWNTPIFKEDARRSHGGPGEHAADGSAGDIDTSNTGNRAVPPSGANEDTGVPTETEGIEQLVMVAAVRRLVPLQENGKYMTRAEFIQWRADELRGTVGEGERRVARGAGSARQNNNKTSYERRTVLALQGVASTRRATEGDTGQTTRIYT